MEPKILNDEDYIQEGINPYSGVLLLACTVGEDYDAPKNRILISKDGGWMEFGSSGEGVLSIDSRGDSAFVLGENGTVIQFDWMTPSTQDELRASRRLFQNRAVAGIGPLRRIRVIGGRVLCGGSVGQLYLLENGNFQALPSLKLNGVEGTIEDISGTAADDVIAVTSEGFAGWYNGSNWWDLDLPTNVKLSSICRLPDGEYAIAGGKGTIIVGSKDRWRVIDQIDNERTYWGIAAGSGLVYAAHLAGVDVLQGENLMPLSIPKTEKFEFAVLRDGPEGVWSFAGQTVGVITDDQWRTVLS